VSIADICVVALAETFRGDGEIFASGMGTIPMLGARVARAAIEPDLLVSDGEAFFITGDGEVEGWIPFRSVFDTLWAGRRHVIMGASQIDQFGNQNIANIGPWERPKAQLLGVRGAPGNTANHTTSYWVPNHSTRVFVDRVDMVSGIGYTRAAEAGPWVEKHHEIRRVVTNMAVIDFETPNHAARLRSVHPGVTVGDVIGATGFELVTDAAVEESRPPTPAEEEAIALLDPDGLRHAEVK
jgi:acyl CoA:acetate/3-ketoacid CoA transferase beta subunit